MSVETVIDEIDKEILKRKTIHKLEDNRYVVYWDEGHFKGPLTQIVDYADIKKWIKEYSDTKDNRDFLYQIIGLGLGKVLHFDSTPMIWDYGDMYVLRVK